MISEMSYSAICKLTARNILCVMYLIQKMPNKYRTLVTHTSCLMCRTPLNSS